MELIRKDGSRGKICLEHRKVFVGKRCPKCQEDLERRKATQRKAGQNQIRVWEQVNGRPFYS